MASPAALPRRVLRTHLSIRIAHNRCINHIARRRPMDSLQALELDPADDTRPIEVTLSQAQDSERLSGAVGAVCQ